MAASSAAAAIEDSKAAMEAAKGHLTVAWARTSTGAHAVRLIDQRLLPGVFKLVDCTTVDEVVVAIRDMIVRGAPAIGATGGFGMALAATSSSAATVPELLADLAAAKKVLDASRPTAVNLAWATGRIMEIGNLMGEHRESTVPMLVDAVIHEAEALAAEDVAINKRMAAHGAEIVPQNAHILHHCNTGALATVDYGTAIGVIYECHRQGKNVHVWVDETRPRLQGAKLTAWELMREGVPLHLIADNAAGHLMRTGKVNVVLFGADRVAANGDVANKIGTYKLCVVAKENGVPAFAVVPTPTIDLTLEHGDLIPIEERVAEEVTMVGETRIAPAGVQVYNPAFDVTPSKYLTGIITEEGICYPPFKESLAKAKAAAEARFRVAWEEKRRQAVASAVAAAGAAAAAGVGSTP